MKPDHTREKAQWRRWSNRRKHNERRIESREIAKPAPKPAYRMATMEDYRKPSVFSKIKSVFSRKVV